LTRLRKALLLLISVLILPISLVWGTLYLAFGATSGYVAYLYFAIVLVAIAVYARTRDVVFLLRVQLLVLHLFLDVGHAVGRLPTRWTRERRRRS